MELLVSMDQVIQEDGKGMVLNLISIPHIILIHVIMVIGDPKNLGEVVVGLDIEEEEALALDLAAGVGLVVDLVTDLVGMTLETIWEGIRGSVRSEETIDTMQINTITNDAKFLHYRSLYI